MSLSISLECGRRRTGGYRDILIGVMAGPKLVSVAGAADVKRLYRTASVVTAERAVFNIKGNDYRLVAAIDFEKGIVWIKWIGTHKDYDRINVSEVEHDG